jgi:hypothetical protein
MTHDERTRDDAERALDECARSPIPPASPLALTRRWFLGGCALGVGSMALQSLLVRDGRAQRTGAAPSRGGGPSDEKRDPLVPKLPHSAARAKRIVYLHMAGAPSQLDLFDPKPRLVELSGRPIPDSFTKGERFAFIKGTPKILGSPYKFQKHGESGHDFSELVPNFAAISDKLAVVRSMTTTQFNHAPAQIFMSSGHSLVGRPSFGSWLSYGLGSMNRDLPTFVVLLSGPYGPDGGASLWSSGFLPSIHQGVRFRSQGDPVLFVSDPPGMSREARRSTLDALAQLDERELRQRGDPEIETRIQQYEMAYRMQASVPELTDLSSEPESIRKMYGVEPGKISFANNALLARRLLERGVRFVQLYHWGWDSHGTSAGDDIVHSLPERCRQCEPASAALITDLEQRGMLDDTLVVWGGEFGRTPMNEERDGSKFLGRDHHRHAFTLLLAGAGIKKGLTLGATDELGYRAVEDPVSVHDLHATLLHLFGFDHTKLVYRSQGRDFRLTDVEGELVKKLLA